MSAAISVPLLMLLGRRLFGYEPGTELICFSVLLAAAVLLSHHANIKRLLAYSSVGQVGLILFALGIASPHGVAGGVDPADVEQQVSERQARIAGAAALIVLSVSMEEMDVYPDERRSQAEWTMTVQSAALAGQNLLLAAHHYGLGACWMCAPLFVPDLIRDALALPPTWHPQALITLGYPAEEATKERADWETRVVWRT
jgi:nitroreductase